MLAFAVAGATLLAGCNTVDSAMSPGAGPAKARPLTSAKSGPIWRLPYGPTGPAHDELPGTKSQTAAPVRVRIPAIGVSSELQWLGLEPDDTMQPPSDWQVAGWYADGVRPGDIGPAIIAGHVDSTEGPAVFYRLSDLHAGERIYVDRADGSTAKFVVASLATYPKKQFPTEAVFGPSAVPTLRLITCTGDFDYATHSYVDNLVVTAYLRSRQ